LASQVQSIVNKVGVIIGVQVAGSTVLEGTRVQEEIDTDELPFFQLFGASRDTIEVMPWRQYRRAVQFFVLGSFKGLTPEQIWADFDLIEAGLDADHRLTNTVIFVHIASAVLDETPATDTDFQTLLFTVEAEVLDS